VANLLQNNTNNIQIVTGVEVIEIVSPMFGKYCPMPKAEGTISQTEEKQFPIVSK